MPMLDEAEWALVERAKEEGMDFVEEERKRRGLPRRGLIKPLYASVRDDDEPQPMLEMYRLLTGVEETNPAAIYHHRISHHGPPCPDCGKPLRTRRARYCVVCGFGMEDLPDDVPPLVERRLDAFDFVEVPW